MAKKRNFNDKWINEFKWLDYREGKMYCSVCSQAGLKNAFTSGCTNFQRSALVRHVDATCKDSSGQHLRALGIIKKQETFKNAAINQIKKNDANEEMQLRTVYWMAKENIAESKYTALIELQKANGAKFPNGTYQHHSLISEMTTVLAQAVRENVHEDIKKSTYFGIICDESCDIANFKKIIIYLTYSGENGISKTSFIDIVDIDDGKADTILDAILSTLNKLNIQIHNIVGLGTDGASVMTGCKGGVGVKLKEAGASSLIHIHCAAHRVSLALSQAAMNILPVKQLELTLSQLFHFFDDSPVRESVLRQIYEINDSPEIKLKEPKQIRWLSLYEAVDAVIKSYKTVVQSLEHIAERKNDLNSVKAKGLLKKIKEPSVPCLLSIILDILTPVKKLNILFQKQNVLFSKVGPLVNACIDSLMELKSSTGENETFFINNCQEVEGNIIYQDIQLGEKFSANLIKCDFISAVIENLKGRFPNISLAILNALDAILNPKHYPQSKDDLRVYGSDELETVIQQYGSGTTPLIDKEKIREDFSYFKQFTYGFKHMSMQEYSTKLITEYVDEFDQFSNLAKIAAVLPVSSADAERGFSRMKLIKTSNRNKISEEKLANLMTVSLEGPSLSESQNVIDNANIIFFKKKTRLGGLNF